MRIVVNNFNKIKPYLSAPSNKLHLLGKQYNLYVLKGNNRLEVVNDDIYIYATTSDKITIQKIVDSFYTEVLKRIVEKNIADIKVKWNYKNELIFKYKNVSSYYGECFFKRNLIILATKMAKYDEEFIINVINHEMCHFYVHNHSASFYQKCEMVSPGFRRLEKEMKSIIYRDAF